MAEHNHDLDTNRNDQPGSAPKPDPQTLHTTDPQEKMEGPVSSSLKNAGKAFDTDESKEEADEKRDRNL